MTKYVVAGPASQALAVQVAKIVDCPLIETEAKKFPDGENYVRFNIEDDSMLQDADVTIIQSTDYPQNDHWFELLYMISIAKRVGADKIRAVVPYFAYSRQDKVFRPGESISATLLLRAIEMAGATEFHTVDLHAPEILEGMNIPAYNLDPMPLLAEYLKGRGLQDPVVISPDKGSRERSEQFARMIGAEVVNFDKSRDRISGDIQMEGAEESDVMLGDKDVAIADDIIATGGTMASALKIAKQSGARNLYALCTHALLIQNAIFKLYTAGAEAVIGTNTVNSPVSLVSVAPVIAEKIQ